MTCRNMQRAAAALSLPGTSGIDANQSLLIAAVVEYSGAGMQRLVLAFINSMRALRHLAQHEKAVQQELILFILAIPLAAFIAPTGLSFLLLTGSVLFLIMIEVLNTGIEAACDAVSRDFHREIQIAKDCGSLAVLISIILVASVWLYTLWNVLFS